MIAADFTLAELQRFTVTQEILWGSESATNREVSDVEVGCIRHLAANNPAIGDNRWPRFKGVSS